MGYPEFRARAMSPRRVGLVAAASLVVFTAVSGLVGSGTAVAESSTSTKGSYSVKVSAERSGESVTIRGAVSEVSTANLIAEPSIVVAAGQQATTRSTNGDTEVEFTASPAGNDRFLIEVKIAKNGNIVQKGRFAVVVDRKDEKPSSSENSRFTGEPIDLSLKDADLRDVIKTFGQLTMIEMRVESEIDEKVTVEWHNVPWDQAFDELMKEHGLTYRVEGSVIHISKK